MFDIITFGSATKDIFLKTEEGFITERGDFSTGRGICFSLGSKINAREIYFTSGGGGTNAAVTFAKQGFSVSYCGKVGADSAGGNITNDLHDYGVDTSLLSSTKEELTNHSVVIDVPDKDRTIFVYRGASDSYCAKEVDFERLKARWFYIAPFSVSCKYLFYDLVSHAKDNDIKVMANPSKSQLRDDKTKEFLKIVDVLLLNMEEAAILTGVPYGKTRNILEEVTCYGKSMVLVTQGPEGVYGYDKNIFYKAKPLMTGAVDRTGAGDSFGSGFLSRFIRTGNIQESIELGIANSTSCLQKKGAKHGLLREGDGYERIPVITGKIEDFIR